MVHRAACAAKNKEITFTFINISVLMAVVNTFEFKHSSELHTSWVLTYQHPISENLTFENIQNDKILPELFFHS